MELKKGKILAPNKEKETLLLDQFARNGDVDALRLLMIAGFDPNTITKSGKSLANLAAEHAARTGDTKAVLALVSYGANVTVRDKSGKSVLDTLSKNPKAQEAVRQAWLDGSGNSGIKNAGGGNHERKEKKEHKDPAVAKTLDILNRVSLHTSITSLSAPKELDIKDRHDETQDLDEERKKRKIQYDIRPGN